MSSMRIPLGLAFASLLGLVVALVSAGPIGAFGVAFATVPLVALVVAFVVDARRRAVVARRPDGVDDG